MLIAKVIGTTVSTIKEPTLEGRKLLILRQTDVDGVPVGKPYVAVDTLDAGIGDLVLTAHGSSGRQTDIKRSTLNTAGPANGAQRQGSSEKMGFCYPD